MKTYEYNIIEVEFPEFDWSKPLDPSDLKAVLNAEGAKGWRYVGTALERQGGRKAVLLSLVFERETTPVRRQRTKGVDPRA
jgi:hypothetical protein